MDLLNIGNRSKTLAFKKFKRLLSKYHLKFVKAHKKQPISIPNMKHVWSIDRLVKNAMS